MKRFIQELFQAPNGRFSMRRFLAFLSLLSECVVSIIGVVLNRPYGVILASSGTLGVVTMMLLFFTTWADVKGVIASITGKCIPRNKKELK